MKDTKMTPVRIRAHFWPVLNSLLDMSVAYQAELLVVTHMSSASSASKADGKRASAYRYKYKTILANNLPPSRTREDTHAEQVALSWNET